MPVVSWAPELSSVSPCLCHPSSVPTTPSHHPYVFINLNFLLLPFLVSVFCSWYFFPQNAFSPLPSIHICLSHLLILSRALPASALSLKLKESLRPLKHPSTWKGLLHLIDPVCNVLRLKATHTQWANVLGVGPHLADVFGNFCALCLHLHYLYNIEIFHKEINYNIVYKTNNIIT